MWFGAQLRSTRSVDGGDRGLRREHLGQSGVDPTVHQAPHLPDPVGDAHAPPGELVGQAQHLAAERAVEGLLEQNGRVGPDRTGQPGVVIIHRFSSGLSPKFRSKRSCAQRRLVGRVTLCGSLSSPPDAVAVAASRRPNGLPTAVLLRRLLIIVFSSLEPISLRESPDARDLAPDYERVDGVGAPVGVDRLHVGGVPHDVVLEEDAVPPEDVPRLQADLPSARPVGKRANGRRSAALVNMSVPAENTPFPRVG